VDKFIFELHVISFNSRFHQYDHDINLHIQFPLFKFSSHNFSYLSMIIQAFKQTILINVKRPRH